MTGRNAAVADPSVLRGKGTSSCPEVPRVTLTRLFRSGRSSGGTGGLRYSSCRPMKRNPRTRLVGATYAEGSQSPLATALTREVTPSYRLTSSLTSRSARRLRSSASVASLPPLVISAYDMGKMYGSVRMRVRLGRALRDWVLTHPNLEQIAQNACALVEKEFTYEKAVERYRDILGSLKTKKQIEAT